MTRRSPLRGVAAQTVGRNPVHPFPARMAPTIPLRFMSDAQEPLRVLDPMMGSGTVVASARAHGHRGYGLDLDPLAVLISRVWTNAVAVAQVRAAAHDALHDAWARYERVTTRAAVPQAANPETSRFVRYWFDPAARRELAALSGVIREVSHLRTRDVLWCAFSRLIITKQAGASLAMDLAHSRPHRAYAKAPVRPLHSFLASVERVLAGCIDTAESQRGPQPVVKLGDARTISLPSESMDLVVTSPPYLNAIDYIRCSKFSLVWMGYQIAELRKVRSESVGTEAGNWMLDADQTVQHVVQALELSPALMPRLQAMLHRYIDDMRAVIAQSARVLRRGGRAVFVVGDNTVRGTYVRNSIAVEELASLAGLRLSDRSSRPLPPNRRYLPPPNARGLSAFGSRMRHESVLVFSKP